ncbi:hypothetical protein [Pedobacter sp.]|nr:hypothetical protein [Pedobacter sp.]
MSEINYNIRTNQQTETMPNYSIKLIQFAGYLTFMLNRQLAFVSTTSNGL